MPKDQETLRDELLRRGYIRDVTDNYIAQYVDDIFIVERQSVDALEARVKALEDKGKRFAPSTNVCEGYSTPLPTTRAIAERCWRDVQMTWEACTCESTLPTCVPCNKFITRIQAAIDEAVRSVGAKPLPNDEGVVDRICKQLCTGWDLLPHIDRNKCLSFVRNAIADLTAERDRLSAKVDELREREDERAGVLQDAIETGDLLRGERDRVKREVDKVAKCLMAEGIVPQCDEKAPTGRSACEAAVEVIQKLRIQLREQQPTPIDPKQPPQSAVDEAELEQVATKLVADVISRRDMPNSCVDEIVIPALRTVAGRPMLAVTELELHAEMESIRFQCADDEIQDRVHISKLQALGIMRLLREKCVVADGKPMLAVTEDEILKLIDPYIEWGKVPECAAAVMRLLRSRCAVVPGEKEILRAAETCYVKLDREGLLEHVAGYGGMVTARIRDSIKELLHDANADVGGEAKPKKSVYAVPGDLEYRVEDSDDND